MNGAIMQRVIGLAIATFAFSSLSGVPTVASTAGVQRGRMINFDQGRHRGAPIDVSALRTAARRAPPMICTLAARAVGGCEWGGGTDAPYTPLAAVTSSSMNDDFDSGPLPAADIQRLLAGLASDDACVRELSIRLIGTQKAETVGKELENRLGSSDASLRAVAALGLGLVEARNAVDPLIRALRDASIDVRANSAWALGRIESGRALNPLINLFGDGAAKVREAAVAAVGHMDSTSAVPALIRVLRQDASPVVRQVA